MKEGLFRYNVSALRIFCQRCCEIFDSRVILTENQKTILRKDRSLDFFMISFHKAEAADRVWAHEILKNCEYPGAEYAFSCMYLWSDYFGELGRVGDHLTQHASWRGRGSISTRQARAISRGAIEAIRADAAERGGPLRLRSLTKDKKEELEALYPGSSSLPPAAIPMTIFTPSRSFRSCTGKSCSRSATTATALRMNSPTGSPRPSRTTICRSATRCSASGTRRTSPR